MKTRTLKISLLVILGVLLLSGHVSVNAETKVIEKPFKPILINQSDIPLPSRYIRADPLEIQVRLEEGRKYHIFLVGEWIANTTGAEEDLTDYDIEVFNSQNVFMSGHTESAGLAEQVANDNNHQYFVPPKSDIYTFVIHNDPEDSRGEDPAVFMIIEHLDMNKRYELYLEGRPSPSQDYPDNYNWAYEFSTPAENYQLHIEVPDPDPDKGIKGLDMYEARIFPMANPSAQVGHTIWGIGAPTGASLSGTVEGDYGGYDTTIKGFSFPNLRASCEYAGEDMDVTFGKPFHNETELVDDVETTDVFYYMVMLAEYYQGTISFFMKTDYRDINVTIAESPEVAITGRETRILVDLESPSGIDEVWLNYTTDDWKTEQKALFEPYNSQYVCWLPRFDLLDEVKYRVYAEDDIDNTGMNESSFIVMDPVDLLITTEKLKVYGGESMRVYGEGLPFSVVKLNVSKGDTFYETLLNVNADGEWSYSYTPPNEGIYTAQLFFDGDETHPPVESREVSFTMEKHKPLISYVLSPSQPKKDVTFKVNGATTPPVPGVTVSFIILSEATSFQEEAITRNDGKFTLEFTPEELGHWQILPQIVETSFVRASSAEIKEFQVISMTPVEKVTVFLMRFTVMPLLVVPIGLVTAGFSYVEIKTGVLRGLIGKVSKKPPKEDEEKPEKDEPAKGATSYRRRSSR